MADGTPLLGQHVTVCHPNMVQPPVEWHLHFATVKEIARGAGFPVPTQDGEDEEQPVVPATTTVLDLSLTSTEPVGADFFNFDALDPLSVHLTTASLPALRQTFYGELAAQRGLGTLLCVSRC
ncbi:MAG: hypothetical protein KDA80_21570 [Planctomycetaceae bacterium]|nr:hypothetical protein [Planctomycetaceae bacterium]